MSLTASEIEYGRLAIERQLVTREQVRECAEMRNVGTSDHLAKLLVVKGYLDEGRARGLMAELSGRPSHGGGTPGSGSWPAAQPQHGSGSGSYPSAGAGQVAVQCPACGATATAYVEQAGQRIRCPGCAGPVEVPRGAGAMAGSGKYQAPSNGGHFTPAPGVNLGGSSRGPAPAAGRTQVVQPMPAPGAWDTRSGSGHQVANGQNGHGTPGTNGHGVAAVAGPGGTHRQAGGGYAIQDALAKDLGAAGAPGFDDQVQDLSPDLRNIAPDDPIAHAMSTRQNADGSQETVFGPYDILGEIARGGMGIVYRARQRSLKRIVALKVMKEGENASEKQIRRFKRETEAAAKLQHPNIVAVHEVGCHEGFHYFTMDLIEGDPLDAICKRGEKLPVERVLQLVLEVAQAIHYAHGKGIIHRDLKPANVLLDTDGHPKVTDFGLAKNIDHKSMLTRTGAVVGTPFYMPPEQARGDVDIGPQADVYALGVILYEMLTLKLPFHGETTMEVYHKILEEEPTPPKKHDSRVNADINTIILKAIEKDLTRRYTTSLDLAEDIQRYLNGDPIKARPLGPIGRLIKRARKNMPVVVVAGVTALALFGGVGLIVKRNIDADRLETQLATDHEWDSFTNEVGNQCINAKSQISSGQARRRDRDPDGALVDLKEALRILGDLSLLKADFHIYNPIERLEDHLVQKKADIAGIYRDTYLEMGRAHVDKGAPKELEAALECYGKGLEHDSTSPESLGLSLEIGRVQALQGQFDRAQKTFAQILEKSPQHEDARLEMGRVHHLAAAFDQAIACYSQVLERSTKSHRAYLLRGQTQFALARFEDAFSDFEKVVEIKDDSFDGYVWRGRTHQALGHWGEAQEDLTEAIDLNPSLPDGYFHRAELYAAQRKHAEAIKDYEVAISRSSTFYRAYLGLGKALEWTLEYERARQQYDEVLKATDREALAVAPEAQAALGDLLAVQSDPLECQLEVEDKLRLEGSTPDGALGAPPPLDKLRGLSEALATERTKSALDAFNQALGARKDLVPALVGRARLAIARADWTTAKTDLAAAQAALAKRPSVRSTGKGKPRRDDEDGGGWDDDVHLNGGDADQAGDLPLAEVKALQGVVALRQNELPAAKAAFQEALSASRASSLAHAGLGHVARAAGGDAAAKARDHFEKAREVAGATPPVDEAQFFHQEGVRYQGLASRSKKPEYFRQARQCFARAMAKDLLGSLPALERARLAAEWSSFDVAVTLADRAVQGDPTLRDAYELLGFLYARDLPTQRDPVTGRPDKLRDPAKAQKIFDEAIAVARTPEDAADARYGRALALLALAGPSAGAEDARVVSAREDLLAASRTIPKNFREAMPRRISQAIAYLELLADVSKQLGAVDGEKEAREQVAEVRKAAEEAAKAELREGQTLRDRLNYSEAIKRFDRAIELYPEFSAAYYERGTCYLKIGNFVPGILDFSRALELDPRIADQVYNKVYQISYVVDLNRVITELNKIVSDHPNVSYVIFLRGFFYVAKTEFKKFEREDLDRGIADFNRCLELNTKHVTALLYRGFLFYKMASLLPASDVQGRQACYDKAMADYAAALIMDPQSGISHYLQALSWSVMSTEEGLTDEQRLERRRLSLAELKTSFSCEFKGFERIKNERGFDAVRNEPEFVEMMRGR